MLGPNMKNSFGLCIAALAVTAVQAILIMVFPLPILFGSGFIEGVLFGQSSFFLTWFMLLLIQLLYGAEVILFCLISRGFAQGLKKKQTAKSTLAPLIWAGAYTG